MDLWHKLLAGLEAIHPALFFVAMALLPLGPFPASVLFISAGVRFGVAAGFVAVMGALAINMTLGYHLARVVLRRPLERWILARGYAIPRFEGGDKLRLLLLFRITPGVPLFLQNYLIGLGDVRFGLYLPVSLASQIPYALGFVWFGQSLTETSGWRIVVGLAGVAAALLLANLVRRFLGRRRAGAGAGAGAGVRDDGVVRPGGDDAVAKDGDGQLKR